MDVVIPSGSDKAPSPVRIKHSGMGIASFIIALINILIFVGSFILAGVMAFKNETSEGDVPTGGVIVGILLIVGFILCLVGTGLGVGAVIQKNRKKTFSVLGLVFNLSLFIGVVTLVIVGISMAKQSGALI